MSSNPSEPTTGGISLTTIAVAVCFSVWMVSCTTMIVSDGHNKERIKEACFKAAGSNQQAIKECSQ